MFFLAFYTNTHTHTYYNICIKENVLFNMVVKIMRACWDIEFCFLPWVYRRLLTYWRCGWSLSKLMIDTKSHGFDNKIKLRFCQLVRTTQLLHSGHSQLLLIYSEQFYVFNFYCIIYWILLNKGEKWRMKKKKIF